MKNIILIFIFSISITSCWAPRCPVSSCHVKFEHVHSDFLSGTFSGRNLLHPPKIHTPWDGDKGETNPDTELKIVPKGGKKKLRKKFPWEKW